MRKANCDEKGITLIALVVTIIILLILAGVTLTTALSQNGLFQRAKIAVEKYKESEADEAEKLGEIEKELDKIIDGKDPTPAEPQLQENATLKVTLAVTEKDVTGTSIPVTVEKIEKGEELQDEGKFTYKWYIKDGEETEGDKSHKFEGLDETKNYTLNCKVVDENGEWGIGEVTVLSFDVVDTHYRGTQGMTWYEWTQSGYKKPFPLNKEHYLQFLGDCGCDVENTHLCSYRASNIGGDSDGDLWYDYSSACRDGLFRTPSTGGTWEARISASYLVFHTDISDKTVIPDKPLDHLRIFKDFMTSNGGYKNAYFDSIKSWNEDTSCIAEGTLITLAGGSRIAVEDLDGDEKVLVWNMFSGKYEASDIEFIVNHNEESKERRIIHAYFSDGTDIQIIKDHGFFDLDLNKFVLIDETNYKDYIGHWFVKESLDGKKQHEKVQLTDVNMESRVCKVYEVITPKNLTCFTNGLLSVSSLLDTFCNIFVVDSNTLTYDKELMEKDIEKYGLFSYEEYTDKLSKEAFEVLNLRYMKIALGKGIITKEHRMYLRKFFNENSASFKSKFDL